MKGKIQRHLIDEQTARMHEAVSDSVYVRGTEVASEGTLTAVLDELAQPKDWVSEKAGITIGKCINTSNNLADYAAAWIWVWKVTAGENVRLSINQFTGHDDSDDGYGCSVGYDTINQRVWTIYDSADPTNWTNTHKLANGVRLSDVTYRGTTTELITIPQGGKVLVASGYVNTNLRFGTNRTADLRPCTGFKLERQRSITSKRKTLKILAVGNSYTCDELSYLPYVMQRVCPDVELTLRILHRGSGTIGDWANNKDATAVGGMQNMWWEWKEFPRWNRKTLGDTATLRACVEADDWDIISFQQASEYSTDYSTIESGLTDIVSWLRTEMAYGGRIAWLLNHAWDDVNLTPSSTSDAMHANIAATCKSVMNSGLVDLLIPSGTAVQNARHTLLANTKSLLRTSSNNDKHLWEGCAPYAAACAACGAIMNMLTPVRVQFASWWAIPASAPDNVVFSDYIGVNGVDAGMDAASQNIAVQCAMNAVNRPYEITIIN